MILSWNNGKNELLKRERGVSFEQIVFLIQTGGVLDILENTNRNKYGNQRMYVVNAGDYAYVVPFVDQGDERFLKTIFPSRKYTLRYLRDKE